MMDTDSYYQAKDTPKIDNKFEVGDLVTQKEDIYRINAHGEKLTVEGVLADIDINIVKNAQGTVFAYYTKELEPYTGE